MNNKKTLGLPKTKGIIQIENQFNEIELEFVRIELRQKRYKDYLIFYKFADDEVFTVSYFTLELNQRVTKSKVYEVIFKDLKE